METNKQGSWAKGRLKEIAGMVDNRLEKYWEEEIKNNFGFTKSQKELIKRMLLHGKEHNLRSAKRARAVFVYYGYLLGQELKESRNQELKMETEKVWRAMEAVELVHTALLIHDDFMDRDEVRRGGPTSQIFFGKKDAHYGESMAVCLGDAVMCLGFERLLSCGFGAEIVNKAMKQFLRGITNTVYGQAYDTSLPVLGKITEEKILGLHRAKTAIYTYENPLLIGGILGGLGKKEIKILQEYSIDGGVAFQLQDDILGVFGNEEKTGKSSNSDLLQGKATLLVAKVLKKGTGKHKGDLRKVWGKMKAKRQDIEKAKKAIRESGSYDYSVKVALKLAEKSIKTAGKLRGRGLNQEAIDYLEGIARYLVEREV